jgi:DNA-binding protein HU-beta
MRGYGAASPFFKKLHFPRIFQQAGVRFIHGPSVPHEKSGDNQRNFACQALPILRQTRLAMNKSELIESIQSALGAEATKRSAEEALDAVLSSVVKGIKSSGKVQIVGFGSFEVKSRAARTGRNPKTGETMQIPASKSLGFKAASALKGSL